MCRSTNRQADPEVWFRVVHVAEIGHQCAMVSAYRGQTVEIALGAKGAFENSNIRVLARRAPIGSAKAQLPRPKNITGLPVTGISTTALR